MSHHKFMSFFGCHVRPLPRWRNPGRAERVAITGRDEQGLPIVRTLTTVFFDATQPFALPPGSRVIRTARRSTGPIVQSGFGQLIYTAPVTRAA